MAVDNPPFRSAAEIAVEFHTAVPDEQLRAYLNSIGVGSISELSELTAVSTNLLQLPSADGIEYATSLTSLSMYACKVPELKIAALVNLENVSMRFNSLTHLYVLRLVNLTNLDISDCLFEQSELEKVVDDLYTNRVSLAALSCAVKLTGNPGSTATGVSKATEISEMNGLGMGITI